MATSSTFSLRARYLFPIDRSPIHDGCITIAEGRIAEIGGEPAGDCRDLGDVAILPALVNAHTHLEFSELDQPLGAAGMPFTEWIREVMRWRRTEIEQHGGTDWRDDPVRQGLAETVRGGATTIGEIATLPWAASDRRYEQTQGVSFLELIGLADVRHDELLAVAAEYLDAARDSRCLPQVGLSPHAPYTVCPKLIESVAALSNRTNTPVAMHLAETREELELLRTGSGLFRQLLCDLDAWHSDVIPLDSTPLDYLQRLATAARALIIHGNYLSDEEIEFAGQQRQRMSVIYCPRTHAYFGHDRYPLQDMLEHGVNVALGTDSRASNPDLNMLREVRFAAKQHQHISLESILRLATINAATALGMSATHGTLTPGKQADLIALPISSSERSDPHELLFESTDGVQLVLRAGEQLFPTSPAS